MCGSWLRVIAGLAATALWANLSSTFAYEPPRGSPVRAAIMDSIRIPVERELGPPVLLTVTALNVQGVWAFASVKAMRPDGKLDWSRTRYARAMASGGMSDSILALLRANGDRWAIAEFALGPTDVPWISWSAKHHIPQKFFQDAYTQESRSPSPAPSRLPPASAPPVQPAPAATGWKTWNFGDLTFRAPANWRNIDSPPARPLRIGGEPWSATFADRNPSGDRHAMMVFTWADDELIYSRSLGDRQIVGRGRQVFADIEGERVFFRIKDRYNDFRGFDVISSKQLKGGTFSFGCRAPEAQWPALADACEEVLASIAFGAGAAPVAPEKPRDEPKTSATPTPEPSAPAKPTDKAASADAAAPASESPATTALRSAELALKQIEQYEKSPRSEDWRLGLAAAQKAVDLDPKSPQFWRLLGRTYAAGAKEMDLAPALAEEAYERAIALDPTHAETRFRLAALLEKREARSAAIEQLEAALSESPSLATLPTVQSMARAYASDDQARRGAAFLARLAEQNPPGHAAQLGQALLLKEDNQTEAALALATQLADDPKAPAAVIEQARTLVKALQGAGQGGK